MTIQPLNATVATPAAQGFAYLLDSTRWGQSIAGTLQPSTSLSSPGTDRDWMTDRWVQGGIQPIGQAVTLLCYTLSPAGAWVHQAALDQTCPAGQVTAFSFAPDTYGAVDGMVAVQAGAVPPTSIGGLGTVSDSAATAAQLAALANLMPTNSNAAVAITGGTETGLTELGVRDTSAAFDMDIAATSSTALTAKRTLTVDVVNANRTMKVTANAEIGGTNTGDQTVTGLGLDALTAGTALTNADATINPGTDKASEYTLPAATLNAPHVLTMGTGGTPTTGLTVWIIRRDLTANTYTINNGGAGGSAVAGKTVILPASPGKPMGACWYYDGIDWNLTAVVYIVA